LNEDLGLGGVETMLVQLANALSQQQTFSIHIASAGGPLVNSLSSAVHHHAIAKYHPWTLLPIIGQLSRIISETKPDVIHSQGATISILAGLAIRRAGTKSVNILTRHSRASEKLPNVLASRLLKKYCDHIVAISNSTYQDFLAAGFENRVSLIPNFVDYHGIREQIASYDRASILKELDISPDSHIVSVAGRLIPAKRFDRFIEILAQAAEGLENNVVGLILGDGESRKELETLAASVADRVRIIFLGYQSEIFKYLSISDLFLFPSEHAEVLPMALIEALSAGTPIVCSNIPGNNEIVEDGFNGFLIDGSDADYVRSVQKVLLDKPFAAKIADNAKKTAGQKYDKAVVVKELIALYQRLAEPDR